MDVGLVFYAKNIRCPAVLHSDNLFQHISVTLLRHRLFTLYVRKRNGRRIQLSQLIRLYDLSSVVYQEIKRIREDRVILHIVFCNLIFVSDFDHFPFVLYIISLLRSFRQGLTLLNELYNDDKTI